MKMVLVMMGILSAVSAQADGFICSNFSNDLRVKVFNHTQPQIGTRSGAVMVVSDPSLREGNKTIATFNDVQGLLSSSSASYEANVDLRFATVTRKGELIGGTKLGELDAILLDVDFTYSAPMKKHEVTKGLITLVKRNGDQIVINAECERYLKN